MTLLCAALWQRKNAPRKCEATVSFQHRKANTTAPAVNMDPKGKTPSFVLGDYPLPGKGGVRLTSKGNLVAFGSAAVLAIYTVGYVYTEPAAQRLKLMTQIANRRPTAQHGWADGTYLGWGRCRHGDLQAAVVIEGGRIVEAAISQCFTRYPKNVIAQLPGQVVARQSADVDQISGATESSDAFFQAVMEALAKAK
jgi:uncharacterized protein with FMN-binding domain